MADRLISADAAIDELLKAFAFHGYAGGMAANVIRQMPTIEAVPLEDYRSMEQTVYKLTQALAEAEPKHLCENCEHYPYATRPLDSDKTHFYTYSYCWKFKAKDYCSKWEKMDEVENG